MRQSLTLLLLCSFAISSCKQKSKTNKEKFFPVLSFIKSQVAHIDTSVYSIRKITFIDSTHNDTSYIKREDFKAAASDFLSIPDLADEEYADRYSEDKQFDETMGKVLITYTPVKPDKEEIQRQEVLIKPEPPNDKVTNFIINTVVSNRDSLVEKKMLWIVDESFQVTVSRQKAGEPETVSTYKVTWNESDTE